MNADDQQSQMTIYFVHPLAPKSRGITPGGRIEKHMARGVFIPESAAQFGLRTAADLRTTRIAILASSAFVTIIGAASIGLFHTQLGIGPIGAARVAFGMIALALAMFFWGLRRILVDDSLKELKEKVKRRPSLSELRCMEFKAITDHRKRVRWVIFLLLCLGFLLPLAGAFVAVFGSTGVLRVGGLAAGAGLGALALFIRGTALPILRQADEGAWSARTESGRKQQRKKQVGK